MRHLPSLTRSPDLAIIVDQIMSYLGVQRMAHWWHVCLSYLRPHTSFLAEPKLKLHLVMVMETSDRYSCHSVAGLKHRKQCTPYLIHCASLPHKPLTSWRGTVGCYKLRSYQNYGWLYLMGIYFPSTDKHPLLHSCRQ